MKYCNDCRHHQPEQYQDCQSPNLREITEAVLGPGKWKERSAVSCLIARAIDTLCGMDGKWWEGCDAR